jgi:hypothetical protein
VQPEYITSQAKAVPSDARGSATITGSRTRNTTCGAHLTTPNDVAGAFMRSLEPGISVGYGAMPALAFRSFTPNDTPEATPDRTVVETLRQTALCSKDVTPVEIENCGDMLYVLDDGPAVGLNASTP